MSIFAANKKWLSIAQTAMSNAEVIAEKQKDINFGRELLANIRQYRIEQAAVDMAEANIGATQVSGVRNARQFLQRQLNEPYSRALQDAERQEQIAELQAQANQAIKKYKKQAKTARTTGYLTAAAATVATVLTAGAASPLAAAAWGAAATAGTMAVGSAVGADRNFQGGAVKGGITATAAMTAAAGGGFLGGGSVAGTGAGSGTVSYTLADGGATMIAATAPSTSWTASQWLAAGTITSTIGGAVKDINNYEVKLPVSQSYTGQNYSQYVQSFRGFA